MLRFSKSTIVLFIIIGSTICDGSVGVYQDQKCRNGVGGNCSCSGIGCIASSGTRNGQAYTVFGCVEEVHMRCIAEGPLEDCECTHDVNETEVLCMTSTWWTGTCANLGNLVDKVESKIDACDSSVCIPKGV